MLVSGSVHTHDKPALTRIAIAERRTLSSERGNSDHPQAGVKDAQADERTWYVVLAYDHERLGYWRPSGVELTTTPVNRLWGPGSWDELRAEVDPGCPAVDVS
jgi:hypothetical protein